MSTTTGFVLMEGKISVAFHDMIKERDARRILALQGLVLGEKIEMTNAYVVRVQKGAESDTCEKLRKIGPVRSVETFITRSPL
jgi:hypothetical protein